MMSHLHGTGGHPEVFLSYLFRRHMQTHAHVYYIYVVNKLIENAYTYISNLT